MEDICEFKSTLNLLVINTYSQFKSSEFSINIISSQI
jgi:hypothetical protein